MQVVHRRDIDGMRAIAVLAVVLYHYGFGLVSAGYAGVDVFFVISGFLIGGIILDDCAAGRFSYRAFYMRRVRRILPALLAMMLLVMPVAALVMSPNELRYFGGGVLSALLFVSNLWFYNLIDYFNPGAALDPMVHTWSLGVEEQFYILAPLLLVWLAGRGRSVVVAGVSMAAAASLALMLAHHETYASATFYQIQYRAWELAAGLLAALALRGGARRLNSQLAAVLATLGLALVLGGLMFIPAGAGWPSGWTLVPVCGTVMILLFGVVPSPARWLLSLQPMVAVGLISYSLYLYHQPVYSLAVLTFRTEDLSLTLRLSLLALAMLLAGLSWWAVEQPFRNGHMTGRRGLSVMGGVATVLLAFAVGGHFTKGYPQRMPLAAQAAILYEDSESPTYKRCSGRRLDGDKLDPIDACTHGAQDVPPTIAIWGDSHAASIAQPLGLALAPAGLALREYTLGGCPPIPNVLNVLQLTNAAVRKSESCSGYTDRVLTHLATDPELRIVVLYAYWTNYTEQRDFDAGNGRVKPDKLYSVPAQGPLVMLTADRLAFLQQQLADAVAILTNAGKEALVIYPLPEAPFEVPQTYAWALWKNRVTEADTAIPTAAFLDYSASAKTMLDALPQNPHLHRMDVSDRLCEPDGLCRLVDEAGVVLYRDANHLSLPGVALIVPDIAAKIIEIARDDTDG